MKQVAQNYRSGELVVLDVPAPACKPGGVLVRSLYSLISTGTELMKVSEARLSLLGKARARPDQVKKLLDSVAQQGPVATYKKAMTSSTATRRWGTRCAAWSSRSGPAPRSSPSATSSRPPATSSRCTPRSTGCPSTSACRCRTASPRSTPPSPPSAPSPCRASVGASRSWARWPASSGSGSSASSSCGCSSPPACGSSASTPSTNAAGWPRRPGRMSCASPDEDGAAYVEQVIRTATGGLGADHVFLAAGGNTNGPVELAARLARDRARVVDIGKTRLDLPWNDYYEKELDVRFSRSYGPGRYDDRYELEGIDYPAGYVRWTERRNLGCFLDLIAAGSVDVGPLVSGTRPITEAAEVYEQLRTGSLRGVGFLFEYPRVESADDVDRGSAGDGRLRRPVGDATPNPSGDAHGAGRLHRRRQLRHLDAAAAPREARRGHARNGRHHPVAVGGQRPAQVRLRGDHDRRRRRPHRPVDRRGLRRDPPPLARRLRLPGARARQGRVRREAAGPHPGGGRRHPRRRRAHRQRPAHGRLQPALRPAARRHAHAVRRRRAPP